MPAVIERMTVKMYHCKVKDVPEWELDEVSTRNCNHCKLNLDDTRVVRCDMGHKLETRGCAYSHVYIITEHDGKAPLVKPCQECNDFSNKWNPI